MLTNYDAAAVAEVLGLAFLQGLKRGRKSSVRAIDAGFVIVVDGNPVLVVDAAGRRAAQEDHDVASPSSVLIEKAVEHGFPRAALRHVAQRLAGDEQVKVSPLEWSLVPKTTLERRATQLSPQESERTERVARLFVHARRALGTEAEAREFMTTPHPELDGRSPVDSARTDLGTRRTEQLLNALEYGLAL